MVPCYKTFIITKEAFKKHIPQSSSHRLTNNRGAQEEETLGDVVYLQHQLQHRFLVDVVYNIDDVVYNIDDIVYNIVFQCKCQSMMF